ncbi:MAG: hypothetical protein COT18_05590 [Elusimicrobia bacterium CG08_land_8_20_14_0_20_59_10]|nr:MAG: hypothetical protein COT18_05590 [Elusimicrobia bacterium CG08_land_8_20_14_0_20_59_10]
MKPRYQIVISLSEEDNAQLQKLRDDGYQIVDIFRLGLTEAEGARKKRPRSLKPKQDKLF